MSDLPKRDVTGECEGECRDRVKEGEEERQETIDKKNEPGSTEETPDAPGAGKRNTPPGSLGGHG
jgi:hypothetical protein